ncbi:MAG: hypothetical protein A2516_06280, partial [Alphaproteobacteria bacterium RIFOXYD12_FULL_60_8]
MTRSVTAKTTFSGGEVSPILLGRGDSRIYENGCRRMRNVFIHPTGGVSRRSGLRYVAQAPGRGRLIAFEFNTEQAYLLVFTHLQMDVYKSGVLQTTVTTPWSEAQVAQIRWTQSADTLLVVHPDVAPKKITRTSHAAWTIEDWAFFSTGNAIRQPSHKFAKDEVTLTPSATTGAISVTASAAVFEAGHVGVRLLIGGKQVGITAYTSATQVSATVHETLANTQATKDWEEQAFSPVRGYPGTVTFHQDRLTIGGSRDLPNRLWMSKSSDLFNFDLGTGLDDEAIEFAILSDQVNAITGLFPGRHLQVLTTGAEWMVTGEPLTPGSIQVRRQTRVGSPKDRNVPLRDVDGATLFVAANGKELREFIFADIEQAYQANDLTLSARHLINAPVDQEYDRSQRLLHVVMGDGSMATITNYRPEQITAWTLQTTDGAFLSIAEAGEEVYVLAQRGAAAHLERFDPGLNTDSAITGTDPTGKTVWTGLEPLEGRTVKVVGDGSVLADQTVISGQITLPYPVKSIEVGLGYTHIIEPLPPLVGGAMGTTHGLPTRLIRATFRLHETAALMVDTGRGPQPIPFKRLPEAVLDAPTSLFSGDVTVRGIGWVRDDLSPLWRVEQDAPL